MSGLIELARKLSLILIKKNESTDYILAREHKQIIDSNEEFLWGQVSIVSANQTSIYLSQNPGILPQPLSFPHLLAQFQLV